MIRLRLIDAAFVAIGICIGVIFSLQIRTNPVRFGSAPADQLQIRKELLETFFFEHEDLKKKLSVVEAKLSESRKSIERLSSAKNLGLLKNLRHATDFSPIQGEGIRITLRDNSSVSRIDFSSINQNFVQAPDLRDLINILFSKDAFAIAINGKRITPLTPIQSVFDSIFVGNIQIAPPFVVEALGNPAELEDGVRKMKKKRFQTSLESSVPVRIPALEIMTSPRFLTATP